MVNISGILKWNSVFEPCQELTCRPHRPSKLSLAQQISSDRTSFASNVAFVLRCCRDISTEGEVDRFPTP